MSNFAERFGRAIARRPAPVIAAAAALAALGIFGSTRIALQTDISKMLPPENPTAATFSAISDAFSTTSTLAVLVEAPSRDEAIAAATTFADRLRSDAATRPLVRSTRLTIDRDFVDSWGLVLQDEEAIRDADRAFASTRMVPALAAANDLLEERLAEGEDVEGNDGEDEAAALMTRFGLFAAGLGRGLDRGLGRGPDGGEDALADELADALLVGDRYLFDPEGTSLLMTAAPTFDLGDRKALSALVAGAQAIARELEASRPGARFRFAGDVATEADEEAAIGADLFVPSLVAFGLVFVLFLFSFRRRRSIAFTLLALAAGIAADLGFIALAVGELNMITSSFGALLVGLGIDFGIHVATRFDESIGRGLGPEEATAGLFREAAGPTIVGALTTAAAFYSLAFSRTLAFRQFGLVAGTGILCILAASLVLLPALLAAFPADAARGPRLAAVAGRSTAAAGGTAGRKRPTIDFGFVAEAALWASRNRKTVLAAAAVLVAAAALLAPRNRFDYDMRRIGPQGTPAQETERLIGERFGIGTYQAMALARSPEEAKAKAEAMDGAPLVRRVESIADYVPPIAEQEARLAAIADVGARGDRIGEYAWDAAAVERLAEEVRRMEMNVIELGDLAAASLGEDCTPVRTRTALIGEIFGAERGKPGKEVFSKLAARLEEDPAGLAPRLAALDAAFASRLDEKITRMAGADRPITEEDLPADLLGDLRSADGALYLVTAQPDRGLEGDASLKAFAEGLYAADPTATGSLLLGLELSTEILEEARRFAGIVFAVVVAIVALSFRAWAPTAASVAAFGAAMAWMLGTYALVGRFNIVNALAIPLIVGVGIDYAVHFAAALRDRDDPRGALQRTGKAVALSASTTLFGFGSLALAGRFKGIADLGAVLFIGTACCLAAAVFAVPALLGGGYAREKGRRIAGTESETASETESENGDGNLKEASE